MFGVEVDESPFGVEAGEEPRKARRVAVDWGWCSLRVRGGLRHCGGAIALSQPIAC